MIKSAEEEEALETKKRGTNFLIRFAVGEGVMFLHLFRDFDQTDPETYCVALDIANQKSGKMRHKQNQKHK